MNESHILVLRNDGRWVPLEGVRDFTLTHKKDRPDRLEVNGRRFTDPWRVVVDDFLVAEGGISKR